MTSPFQSITEPGERKTFERAPEVFPVPGQPATTVAAEDALFGHSDLDGRVETGLGNVWSLLVSGATGSTGPANAAGTQGSTSAGPTEAPIRKPLCGGEYGPQDALDLLNLHYLIGKSEHEVAIFRIRDDGLLTFTPPEQFKLDVANIFVQPSSRSGRPIPVEKYWKESPFRHQRVIVFKPTGATKANEFNLWRGFAIAPRKGWQKQRRLLRHILKVICRRDKVKFKYIIRWLAWAVQNPDKQAAVVVMTTNHDHAVGAGVGDRRFVVYDISDAHACDKSWFDPIYRDLDEGGASEFLRLLQDLKLGSWHPREILKTEEATEQQRMSGDSISQWSQACVEADAIIGDTRHWVSQHYLGGRIAAEDLREAYTGFCKQHGLRSANREVFGKACAELFGPRQRLSTVAARATTQTVDDTGAPDEADAALDLGAAALPEPRQPVEPAPATARGKSRPWGYDVPNGDTWQGKIDDRLGIKK